jgi:hypothetical protein
MPKLIYVFLLKKSQYMFFKIKIINALNQNFELRPKSPFLPTYPEHLLYNIFHVTAWPHVSAQSWDWIEGCYKNTPYTFHTHPLPHMGCGPHVVGPNPYERVGVYRVCKWYFFSFFRLDMSRILLLRGWILCTY